MPETHDLEILEMPCQKGPFHWLAYLPLCSCGNVMTAPPGRYWTEAGAQMKARSHHDLVTGQMAFSSTSAAELSHTLKEAEAHLAASDMPTYGQGRVALVEDRNTTTTAQGFRVRSQRRERQNKDLMTFPVIRANQETK